MGATYEGVNVRAFIGREREPAFWDALREVGGRGFVSPGGAAERLGVARQRIFQLIKDGRLRAWMYYHRAGAVPSYVMVSVDDLEAHRQDVAERGRRNLRYTAS